MGLTAREWHLRYQLQATWTEELRELFISQLEGFNLERVLDIGCGTGALLPWIQNRTSGSVIGADLRADYLEIAHQTCSECIPLQADAHRLPFPEHSFDLVICHYFLLWTKSPQHVLDEIVRVIRPGGMVAAFAEPDYGGRIDYPPHFDRLREAQIKGLLAQGANPVLGRSLPALFQSAGLNDIFSGVYQGFWKNPPSADEIHSEWEMLKQDLSPAFSPEELKALQEHDLRAWQSGTRLVYVPTFYAWGKAS